MAAATDKPTYRWSWRGGFIYVHQLPGGFSPGFEGFPAAAGKLENAISKYVRHKSWFTRADEQAIRAAVSEAGVR